MEGDEKSLGSNKRSKLIPLGFGSCEDETIGSLFKLKNKKIRKKKEVVTVEIDLGGLDDTLASLKKKLKGPKRGVLDLNVCELSGKSASVSGSEGDFGTGMKELGKVIDENGLNAGICDKVENKEKAKRVKKTKKNKDQENENENENAGSDVSGKDRDLKIETKELKKVVEEDVVNVATYDELENKEKAKRSKSVKKVKKDKYNEDQGSKTRLNRVEKVRDLSLESDLNDNLEDSLSVLLRKAQSGSIKRCGINSKTKHKSKTQTLKDGERSNGAPKDLRNVDEKEESSSLLVSQNPQECDDTASLSTLAHENIRLCQSSDEHIENTSTPIDIDAKLVSSVDKDEDPRTVSAIERPLSEFSGCSHKNLKSDDGVTNEKAIEDFGLAQPQSDFTECFDNEKSEDKVCDDLEKNCFVQNRELTTIEEEMGSDHDGCDPLSQNVSNDGSNGASSLTVSPDRYRNYKEVLKSKEKKLSELFKRRSKKRRHEDMACEGDVDWDGLIQEQGFSQSRLVEYDDLLLTENVRAAAVSAGLKAHEVGPVEKIKFKDVFKCKGDHQEYLICRNQILALWSKDVTRVLPLTECGDDSLTKEIYEFLSRSGYINSGIASDKDVTDFSTDHNLKLVEAETFGKADTDEGVCFILGQCKNSEVNTVENSNKILDDNNQIETTKEKMELDTPQTDELHKAHDNAEYVKRKTELTTNLCAVQSISIESDNGMDCVSDETKRVIVIGAGPAGLTAARHLQRHGFSVDVLEARERIGGRVYTDKSSLSVPVDLGASIITGVEADVASERRADPSALICAQLGLELTVLKSNCPLYDVVTGQKVPTDLDENLEAEYNGLLDDMLLLVAQRGEKAMKMSLEDGLEYALKSRRKNYVKNENSSKDDVLSPLERRVMNWHFAHLEYGCAAVLQDVSLPYWNQDDIYGGFGGAHCMIKGGYSAVVESMGKGLNINLNQVVTNIAYGKGKKVKVCTSNGKEFSGDVVLVTVPLGCLKARDIEFSPPLPYWKDLSIQRLGFGVLNKVAMEFPTVFWDETVDYFGATAEETDLRGKCFMFWNVKKTVGANILIALVVGKAAIEGQKIDSSDDLINHALAILRKFFGKSIVPDPVGSIVTDWGNDPFSYGAYSYVSIGSSGEDYDILGKPVENCLFFAGEATCKEYPDTVGGAMLSGLREAVRIIDLLITGNDYTAEVEALEAMQRRSECERTEVRDIAKRLEAIELSNAMYKDSLEGARTFTRKSLLKDMFYCKTTSIAGRLLLAKELLSLPVEPLKSFAGTKAGLGILNTWILDSMGKDGTQLLRHCVRLLVLVSTDLLAVRLSGVGKTIKEKVCVHTSRDIRAIASQLVNVWIEVFRKEKASNSGLKLLRQSNNKRSHLPPTANQKKISKPVKLDTETDSKTEFRSSKSQGSVVGEDKNGEMDIYCVMSEEEKAAFAAAETARAAALAAAEAYASSEAKCNTSLPLPKIPSFHKFTRREQYIHMDDFDVRKKCSEGASGRQDCISETDSRNCRVRDWSVSFPAAYADLENTNNNISSADINSQRSHSPGSAAVNVDADIYTKAWVDGCGSDGLKDYNAIDRWQSQAEAAESDFYYQNIVVRDEEDSNVKLKLHFGQNKRIVNESSVSQVTVNKDLVGNQPRGTEKIKQAVVDFVASLLMPLYKAKKIDKDGYKSIMKKTATKVMEQTTDAEKGMAVSEFLNFKRKNKIRTFVDKLIEKHMGSRPVVKP